MRARRLHRSVGRGRLFISCDLEHAVDTILELFPGEHRGLEYECRRFGRGGRFAGPGERAAAGRDRSGALRGTRPDPRGEHGTLLKYLPVDGLVAGADAYKIMYLSTSLQGEPIVVTGSAVIPAAAAPPDGRVVLAIAHGTTGVADSCAPSKNPERSEITPVSANFAVANNWIATQTDYEGLGTPGRHPYLVGESEGRGVIDSVTAASQLPDADAGDRVVVAGYSQGGHGALWANQVAAEWAPDLDIVATFAGAPATEIDTILRAARRLPINGFALSIIAGYEAAYPDAKPSSILTEKGLDVLGAVDEGCVGDVFRAAGGIAPADLVRADGPASEPWAKLCAREQPGAGRHERPDPDHPQRPGQHRARGAQCHTARPHVRQGSSGRAARARRRWQPRCRPDTRVHARARVAEGPTHRQARDERLPRRVVEPDATRPPRGEGAVQAFVRTGVPVRTSRLSPLRANSSSVRDTPTRSRPGPS